MICTVFMMIELLHSMEYMIANPITRVPDYIMTNGAFNLIGLFISISVIMEYRSVGINFIATSVQNSCR